ncbi:MULTISPECIES: TetR/AcrR family transcriptional regulator [unclassified Streptomyces]|uniref:TetR/AcrR family transcriptional regulator n=1 Tax=unclassified Streptomyces TaxID=2593676 RepID=UPI002E125228|nr:MULTISPECIES: TetR/AcrR family transcriptional regulator [unclassified Streptomyces]WSR24315.1 TetR/AcrR family transcriptional regulator [Streptomyces sp. NBC_01205]
MDSPPSASDLPERVVRKRTGGRGARIRSQVLAAVGELLVEDGYDRLTVDAVAARADVHRTTVYRRWRDVGGLLVDLLDSASDDSWGPPDTGSLEGDLTALNQEVFDALAGDPTLTTALIAASFRSEDAARALSGFWDDRYARSAPVVTRAVARGEAPAATDPRAVLVTATAPLYHELLLLRATADPALPRRAARAATTAARAGAFACPAPADG